MDSFLFKIINKKKEKKWVTTKKNEKLFFVSFFVSIQLKLKPLHLSYRGNPKGSFITFFNRFYSQKKILTNLMSLSFCSVEKI